jgi:TonB family protein
MFLAGDVVAARSARTPAVSALGVSALAHLAPLLLILIVTARVNPNSDLTKIAANLSSPALWFPEVGGQSSGGSPDVRLPRVRQISSTQESPTRTPQRSMVSQSPAAIDDVPVVTTIPDLQVIPGIASPLISVASADGTMPGGGERASTDRGAGPGGGGGPGGNTGSEGDLFHTGNGATSPLLIEEVKPQYTSEAMRARIQGTVLVTVVVMPDGSVGAARIVRSLDPVFGLDQEALRAVKLWRFSPGKLGGRPVPVAVNIELTFTLR